MQAKAEYMAAQDAKRAETAARLEAQKARIEAAKNDIAALKDRRQEKIDAISPRTDRSGRQLQA